MANVNLNSALSLFCYNNDKTNKQTVFFQTKDAKLQRMTKIRNRPTNLQVNSIERRVGPQDEKSSNLQIIADSTGSIV